MGNEPKWIGVKPLIFISLKVGEDIVVIEVCGNRDNDCPEKEQ